MHRFSRLAISPRPPQACTCTSSPFHSQLRLYSAGQNQSPKPRDSSGNTSSSRNNSFQRNPFQGDEARRVLNPKGQYSRQGNNSNPSRPAAVWRPSSSTPSQTHRSQSFSPNTSNYRDGSARVNVKVQSTLLDGIGEQRAGRHKRDIGKAKDSSRRAQAFAQDSNSSYSSSGGFKYNTRSPKFRAPKLRKAEPVTVEIPTVCSVHTLAGLLNVRLQRVLHVMRRLGLTNNRPDTILQSEDATLVALEFGRQPVIDDTAALDLFAAPPHPDPSSLPLRPPVVAIMGHVDHGKTTLLDKLRSTSVAAGESGGITQHIGAFTVPLKSSTSSVTFLDTPGHAAFSSMRARGAHATDIVVLVVAADDGVKTQTREVINLLKDSDITNVVVALTKCDKQGVTTETAKLQLGEAGIHVEEFGGEVPLVEVSGKTGEGLDELVETLSTVSEIIDIRADPNARVEGVVVESRKEVGKGTVATVLVKNGTLTPGKILVSGTVSCRVRTLEPTVTTSETKIEKVMEILPGIPVQVTGWGDLPGAGEEVLEAKDLKEANTVINNRKRKASRDAMVRDVEIINEKRKEEAEIQAKQVKIYRRRQIEPSRKDEKDPDETQLLNIIVKGDVSGSVEAVKAALSLIGNSQAKAKVLHTGVGPITPSDIQLADTMNATIAAFNVPTEKKIKTLADSQSIPLVTSPIIYRLVESITAAVTDLLPQKYEAQIISDAKVQAIFDVQVKGQRQPVIVAGCRVTSGTLKKKSLIRVVRNETVIHEGTLSSLKHVKDEVEEINPGSECGLSVTDYSDIRVGDTIQAYEDIPIPKRL